MNDFQQDRPEEHSGADAEPSRSDQSGRRRFLGAGTAATPFLLTLVSQPALATTCFTPSRNLSRNTSVSQRNKNGDCTGISPGNYKAQTGGGSADNWPASPRPDTAFHPLFFQGTRLGSFFLKTVTITVGTTTQTQKVSMTLLEVLNLTGNADPNKTAFHIIGAYLNCVNGFIPAHVLTKEKVQAIWQEYALQGYYEVTAGVRWDGAAIVDYLKSNGIAP